jgi:[heparan sulfate]-glucosamine 3-sulfotransferase 5
MNSSIKLLLIVREPVTRAISDYTQLKSHSTSSSYTASTTPSIQQLTSQTQNLFSLGTKSFEELSILSNGSVNSQYRLN